MLVFIQSRGPAGIAEFQAVQAPWEAVDRVNFLNDFLIFVQFIEIDAAVETATGQEVRVGDVGDGEKPAFAIVAVGEGRDWPLLVH